MYMQYYGNNRSDSDTGPVIVELEPSDLESINNHRTTLNRDRSRPRDNYRGYSPTNSSVHSRRSSQQQQQRLFLVQQNEPRLASHKPWREVNDKISARMVAASSDSPPIIPNRDYPDDTRRRTRRPKSRGRDHSEYDVSRDDVMQVFDTGSRDHNALVPYYRPTSGQSDYSYRTVPQFVPAGPQPMPYEYPPHAPVGFHPPPFAMGPQHPPPQFFPVSHTWPPEFSPPMMSYGMYPVDMMGQPIGPPIPPGAQPQFDPAFGLIAPPPPIPPERKRRKNKQKYRRSHSMDSARYQVPLGAPPPMFVPPGPPPMMAGGPPPMMGNGHPTMMPNGSSPMMVNGHQPMMANGFQPMMAHGPPPMMAGGPPPPFAAKPYVGSEFYPASQFPVDNPPPGNLLALPAPPSARESIDTTSNGKDTKTLIRPGEKIYSNGVSASQLTQVEKPYSAWMGNQSSSDQQSDKFNMKKKKSDTDCCKGLSVVIFIIVGIVLVGLVLGIVLGLTLET